MKLTDIQALGEAHGDRFALYHGDNCEVIRAVPDDSAHFTIYSPPFPKLNYVYSNSPRDIGNGSDAQYWKHYRILIRQNLRITRPGRLAAVHCMTIPLTIERDGREGLFDYRGEIVRAHEAEGWLFHSEVCIWKDPVQQMQRTKAHGLLHKSVRTNGSITRQGLPDWLVVFRKPGKSVPPVTHTREEYPVALWQRIASPVWMDIDAGDTLQRESAREDDDERHICPLQLEVIRRGVELWTNPDEIVFSPCAGIGSEGHIAVGGKTNAGAALAPRRFVGIELKDSYFRQAAANIKAAASPAQKTLFAIGA